MDKSKPGLRNCLLQYKTKESQILFCANISFFAQLFLHKQNLGLNVLLQFLLPEVFHRKIASKKS
jgi:hypothetical protein